MDLQTRKQDMIDYLLQSFDENDFEKRQLEYGKIKILGFNDY